MNLFNKSKSMCAVNIGLIYFVFIALVSLLFIQSDTEYVENIDVFHVTIGFSSLYLYLTISIAFFIFLYI
jgi:hypothetical protein